MARTGQGGRDRLFFPTSFSVEETMYHMLIDFIPIVIFV